MLKRVWYLVYDEGEGGEGGEGSASDAAVNSEGAAAASTPEPPKNLAEYIRTNPGMQDQLNKMMAENKKNLTKQNQDLMKELTTVKERFTGTAQEKDELEQRIEQLQNQFLSKEELAKRESEKARKEHQKALEKTTQELDTWKTMYTDSRIKRELLDAAISGKAINPDILVDMLAGKTYLAPKIVDGSANGEYEVRVKFSDTDEEGNPVTLELSPEATVKRMQDLVDKYGVLFESTATSGVGSSSGMGGNAKPAARMSAVLDDQEAFLKWRKDNPDLDISKLRR